MMKHTRRWILALGMAVILLVAACAVELAASQARQASMWQLAPLSFEGFYGAEESTTLPGVPDGQPRTYRWSEPASRFSLWPRPPAGSALALEYLDTIGATTLQLNQDAPIALAPAQQLRRLHLLLPPASDLTIHLAQTQPQTIDGRQLGLIVGDVRWSALGWRAGLGDGRVLFGLPLTLLLLGGLGWALRLPLALGHRSAGAAAGRCRGLCAAMALGCPRDAAGAPVAARRRADRPGPAHTPPPPGVRPLDDPDRGRMGAQPAAVL